MGSIAKNRKKYRKNKWIWLNVIPNATVDNIFKLSRLNYRNARPGTAN